MNDLVGTATLLRLAARRDRLLIGISALALAALSVASAQATVDLYPDANVARASLGGVLTSPSALMLYGPASTKTLEGLSVFKTQLMGAVLLGILAYAVVRRHTRVEEEDGRLELLGATVVGRQAALTASVILALIATVTAAGLSVVGLVGIGFDAAGSVALGVAWLIAGLLMTGATAVAAQLTSSARGCAAWALGFLGALYVLRAIGDVSTGAGWLSWVSPLGWVNKVGAYDQNRIWLILPALALCAVLVAVAYALLDRRDLGAGVLAARPGAARGGATMRSAPGLAWRLGLPTVIGWTVAFVVFGAVVGGLADTVKQMLDDPAVTKMLQQLGGTAGTLTDIYLAAELHFMAAAAAAAGIALALRLATEERTTRAEAVLATTTSRTRWYLSNAALAVAVPVLLMALVTVVVSIAGSRSAGVPAASTLMRAGLATLPAVWVCVAAALALAGLRSRLAPYAWAVFAVAFVLSEFGALIDLPQWLIDVSPLAHMPQLPGGTFDTMPAVVLTLIALALVAAGAIAHRHRDLG